MDLLYVAGDEFRSIVFDATISELHQGAATATEHPVETGVAVSDHVIPERRLLSVEVHVSNTPIRSLGVDGANGVVQGLEIEATSKTFARLAKSSGGGVERAELVDSTRTVQASVLQFATPFDRVQAVYDQLDRLRAEGIEVSVFTDLKQYDAMVITSVQLPRRAEDGTGGTFAIELAEVRFAESAIVDLPDPVEPRGERRRARGAQATEEQTPPASTRSESAWHAGADSVHNRGVMGTIERLISGQGL